MKKIVFTIIAALTVAAANGQEFGTPRQLTSGAGGLTFAAPAAASRAAADVTVTPTPGKTLSSLRTFTLTFNGAAAITVNALNYGNAAYVLKNGAAYESRAFCFTATAEGNKLTLGLNSSIAEAGSYTLTVPADLYNIDGAAATETLTYGYVVDPSQQDAGIIYDSPAGKRVECMTNFDSWFVINGSLWGTAIAGKPTHYIVGNDNCLYLYNPIVTAPFGNKPIGSYIKGEKSDGKYLFKFPQPVYSEYVEGEEVVYYMNSLVYNTTDKTYDIASDNSIAFAIRDNGSVEFDTPIIANESDYSRCIGTTDANGKWNGFGNMRMTYTKFNYTAPVPPGNDVQVNAWTMTYSEMVDDGETLQYGQTKTKEVYVGFKGTDIWIKGLGDSYLPDAWAHGTISGATVTLDTYLGISESAGQHAFLYCADLTEFDGFTDVTFTYDAAAETLTCANDLVVNPNDWFYYTLVKYGWPTIKRERIEYTTLKPKAPLAIENFHVLRPLDGYTMLTVYLSAENINGQPLNETNLYYQIMLPTGEPYTFDPLDHTTLTEAITDVPYTLTQGIATGEANGRNLFIFSLGLTNIGARMIYKDETGDYYSDITWYDPSNAPDGIDDIENDETVATIRWFYIMGREVANPTTGVYIQNIVYTSGKHANKIVKR